jgi:hypothetical protein
MSRTAYAQLWEEAHSGERVVQCPCGASSPWGTLDALERAGWVYQWRVKTWKGERFRLAWTCPECAPSAAARTVSIPWVIDG